MRPISVRFQCFGPYMEEQYIDFSKLGSLFLICGETGAGKTTILDAICYALYGRSSGGLRGGMEVMRCQMAGPKDKTIVAFEFECNGKQYQFVRTLSYGRKNLNDEHNCMVLADGAYVPLLENPKKTNVNDKAQELIGLTYDQFRQVIILPQGQFEKLLVSESDEKEKILVTLFNAERWQKLSDILYERVKERDKTLNAQRLEMDLKLKDYGCESVAALGEHFAEAEASAAELKESVARAERDLKCADAALSAALLEDQDFLELEKRKQTLSSLNLKAETMKREKQILSFADDAERLKPVYEAFQNAAEQKNKAAAACAAAKQTLAECQKRLEQAKTEKAEHDADKAAQEQRRTVSARLEAARGIYAMLAEKAEAAAQAKAAEKQAGQREASAKKIFEDAEEAWKKANLKHGEAITAYARGHERYSAGICGTLAAELKQGLPCPVCGSTEHPMPAAAAENAVTEAEVKALKESMEMLDRAEQAAKSEKEKCFTILRAEENVYKEAQQAAVKAETEYVQTLGSKIEGIESAAELEKQLAELGQQIRNYDVQTETLNRQMNDAAAAHGAAKAELERTTGEQNCAEKQLKEQEYAWTEALAASRFEEVSAFQTSLMEIGEKQERLAAAARYDADFGAAQKAVAEQSEKVAGKTAPDLNALKESKAAAQKAWEQLKKQADLAVAGLEQMHKDLTSLTEREEKHKAERICTDADLTFARRLVGTSGVSLQRYVLGVMLSSVTTAANRLLQGIYGGRYQLYRTDEIAGRGRKGGLELVVYDRNNNERRSVTTLSGGEKFLVALSLAVGLSEVVQAQGSGIRMEAMFVDEGFGSLDRDAIHDALDILQSVRSGSGMVGIISHVEQLEETIPTKIEAKKGKYGSQLIVT